MKLIIKQPIDKKEWSTIFCVGDNACEKGGTVSNAVLEKMKSHGIIQVMDPAKLMDTHSKHAELIADTESYHYLGIGPDEKYPVISTVYKTELFCDECGIVHPIHEHIFERDFDTEEKIKFITNMRCPKCNDKFYYVCRSLDNEKAAESRQEFLKKLGETWTKLY